MEIIPTPRPSTHRLPSQTRPQTGPPIAEVPIRTVGPGRLERGYQNQIARLYREIEALQGGYLRLESELETAHLVERGTARFVDRIESRMEQEQAQSRRLLVLVGSLQRENERLVGRIEGLQANQRRIEARAEPRPFWRRFGLGRLQGLGILSGRTA